MPCCLFGLGTIQQKILQAFYEVFKNFHDVINSEKKYEESELTCLNLLKSAN